MSEETNLKNGTKDIENKADIAELEVVGANELTDLEIDARSYWKDAGIRFMRNKAAVVSTLILLFIILFVIIAPFFYPWTYDDIDWDNISVGPSAIHWLGTDENGRDVLSRIAFGGRISLTIGFLSGLVSVIIGVTYGAVSGYFGGIIDSLLMRILEILSTLPSIFLVILTLTLFGNSLFILIGLISVTAWYGKARLIRGITISIKNREFVDAARVIGVSQTSIIMRHIVPNMMSTIIVYLSISIPGTISTESALSYLGLGVQEPLASWGTLISDGSQVMQTAPWLLFFPSLFLSTTIFCFTYIGDGLRDAFDPKDR